MSFRAVAILVGLGAAAPALGGGFANLDIGGARCGMLAVVASIEDPTAVYHNPANLVDVAGDELAASLNYVSAGTEIRYRYPDGAVTDGISPTRQYGFVPFLGGAFHPGGNPDLAAGCAAYFPNLYGVALPEDAPTRYLATEALFVTGYFTPAVAWRPWPWVAAGAGFDLIYVYLASQRAFNLAQFASDDFRTYRAEDDYRFRMEGDDWTWSYHAGVTLEPCPRLRLAAVYYRAAEVNVAGDLEVDTPPIAEQAGLADFTTYLRVGMLVPASWRFGAAYDLGRRWTVAFDYNWWKYSDYRRQEVSTGVGEELGFGEFDMSSEKNYTNSKNMALGLTCRVAPAGELRAGLQRDWTPVPRRSYSLDNPILSYWGWSLGGAWDLTPRLRAEAAYVHNEFARLNNRQSETSPPTNGIGDATWHGFCLSALIRL